VTVVPALPWTAKTAPDAEATYVVMGTYLPLRGYRFIPRFLAETMKIRRQLAGADGLVGYALDAHLLRKEFFTVSVWENREALDRFARAEPHASITRATPKRMGHSKFRTWSAAGGDVPVGWDAVRTHLAS
jgi:heme-degrading monooxygenase HmoA